VEDRGIPKRLSYGRKENIYSTWTIYVSFHVVCFLNEKHSLRRHTKPVGRRGGRRRESRRGRGRGEGKEEERRGWET